MCSLGRRFAGDDVGVSGDDKGDVTPGREVPGDNGWGRGGVKNEIGSGEDAGDSVLVFCVSLPPGSPNGLLGGSPVRPASAEGMSEASFGSSGVRASSSWGVRAIGERGRRSIKSSLVSCWCVALGE